jgi:hypothetical protein
MANKSFSETGLIPREVHLMEAQNPHGAKVYPRLILADDRSRASSKNGPSVCGSPTFLHGGGMGRRNR